jgi:hypothetical protein
MRYEIDNGLLGVKRDILLIRKRNLKLGDADLQQIIGMSPGTVVYRNHYLFQNRKLSRPYNEPPLAVDVSYPKF